VTGRRFEAAVWIGLVSMVLITLVAVLAAISFQNGARKPDTLPSPGQPASSGPSGGTGGAAAVPADCPAATVTVTTAAELTAALAAPPPGSVILLADGEYVGNFVGTGAGTSGQPVMLCGGRGAVLDGGGPEDGYVLHLDRASYWTVQGFTIRNGQKGVMLDGTTQSVIQNLMVEGIGDEAIHLRRFSSENRVVGNTVAGAGLRKPKFGEGIYIGTAESNWCGISSCEPDKSDRNEIRENTISGTTAESVDIKEGTSDGLLIGNKFEGSSMQEADSWVDVKGNGWRIERNIGRNSPLDGFQTHEILDGWGTGNVFRENTAEVNGPGFGYSLKPVRDNVVDCSNAASQAEQGLSNLPCTN
jgi:hypothetical protein